MPDAIVVRNLGVQFRRHHDARPSTLKEVLLHGLKRSRQVEQFAALSNISFSVAPGSTVGVIGRNGAGKSTLLRLIGGVGRPHSGSIDVHGRIGALLDLGTGFHPDLTGRENVYVGGVIGGLTRREIVARFDSIVDFAELSAVIDNPMRTYSTGMQMRLAFAVAAHLDPEILLIDEVLAVGDLSFQSKCFQRISEFKASGCTILLVSHDTSTVETFCDEVLWLKEGKLIAEGTPDVVVGQYVADMKAETERRTPLRPDVATSAGSTLRVGENRYGSFELEIAGVRLLDRSGMPVTELNTGDQLDVEINYQTEKHIPAPIFSVAIMREDGLVCYDSSTEAAGLTLPTVHGSGHIVLHLERLDLSGGRFYIHVGAYEREWAYVYDYHSHVYPIDIRQGRAPQAILAPPQRWEVHTTRDTPQPLFSSGRGMPR